MSHSNKKTDDTNDNIQGDSGQVILDDPFDGAPEPAVTKVEKGDLVQPPAWCNFMREHVIPINGWNYKCIGYTPKFEVVLECVGPTSATVQRYKKAKIPVPAQFK